ncbi:sigma-70 family RNA polymerase sigma factor [Prolixibacteraceae bacterium]|nr:sigma-70 family RNA polymerase sigma factor [Prolixibacteraceae bacterium]
MAKFTNEEIIYGIKNQDHVILHSLYRSYFKVISYYIQNNSGTEEDASDVFQESMIVIYRKIQESNFELTCSFDTYLYAVCRNLWLKELKKRDRISEELVDESLFSSFELEDDMDDVIQKNERYRLYQKHFNMMGEDCKKLMTLFLKKVPLKEIARLMNYSSEQYAKKRKFRCKEYLIKSIQNDEEFKDL